MKTINYHVFDYLLEGVQVINADYRYVYVNKTVVKQGKTTRAQLIGNKMSDQYPGIENTEMFAFLTQCMETRTSHTMENRFTYPDGEIGYFELRMQPVPDGVLIMSIDISERKRMEAELKRMNLILDELVTERTQELLDVLDKEKRINEIKSRFISLISHEFKTPLVAIKVTVNALEHFDKKRNSEMVKKHLDNINTTINDMFELLDEYLSRDKEDSDKALFDPQDFNLLHLIEQEVGSLSELCKHNQAIEVSYSGIDIVKQDKKIIKSVLINLLSNSIKYSDKNIELIVDVQDEYIQLDVIDHGIGIPEEDQSRLFNEYFRARNVREIQGTGLGLNIVKQYVESINGSIGFHSEIEKGSHFKVALPNYG